jgi:large subunit ribosomal protein L18
VNKEKFIQRQRQRRRFHVRKKVPGTSDRPRMCVFRSHRHIACQLIDDLAHRTLVSVSTQDEQLRQHLRYGGNKEAAEAVGKAVAERAMAAGIRAVRFDRGHYKFHGRVAALAGAAREAGLAF